MHVNTNFDILFIYLYVSKSEYIILWFSRSVRNTLRQRVRVLLERPPGSWIGENVRQDRG